MSIKPLFCHTLFNGPSKGQDRNGCGPRLPSIQYLCVLVHGRAGREDFVNQQNPLVPDLCGTDQAEPERALEQTGRERLVKIERVRPAGETFMLRAVSKGLVRTEGSAAEGQTVLGRVRASASIGCRNGGSLNRPRERGRKNTVRGGKNRERLKRLIIDGCCF
jgi:hypothetical protein